jgi:hypothetical protein
MKNDGDPSGVSNGDENSKPKITGARGGRARAERMSGAERKKSAQQAATARWAHPRATHEGLLPLPIDGVQVECAVLENGQRVISATAFQRALGRSRAGGQTYQRRAAEDGIDQLPIYVALKNLKPFIPKDFSIGTVPYIRAKGGMAIGVSATIIPAVCSIWLAARRAGVLNAQQMPTAEKAELINSALATVGIIALVDEATGYHADRARDALALILEAFIGKELATWAKTFDDEFYRQMFRLRDWSTEQLGTSQRPPLIGKLTNNIVYERLAPAVLDELKRKNPRLPSGSRRTKHHQWLSSGFGHPKLREHLAKVIALMQVSKTWDEFMARLDFVAPKHTGYLFSFEDTHRLPETATIASHAE